MGPGRRYEWSGRMQRGLFGDFVGERSGGLWWVLGLGELGFLGLGGKGRGGFWGL